MFPTRVRPPYLPEESDAGSPNWGGDILLHKELATSYLALGQSFINSRACSFAASLFDKSAASIRPGKPKKHDFALVMPIAAASSALAERMQPTMDGQRLHLGFLGKAINRFPSKLLELIDSQLAPEDRLAVEAAIFSALSLQAQEQYLSRLYSIAFAEKPPSAYSWRQILLRLSRKALPKTDPECLYRVFAGVIPLELACQMGWLSNQNQERVAPLRQILFGPRTLPPSFHLNTDFDEIESCFIEQNYVGHSSAVRHGLFQDGNRYFFTSQQYHWDDRLYWPRQKAFSFVPLGRSTDPSSQTQLRLFAHLLVLDESVNCDFLQEVLSDRYSREKLTLDNAIPSFGDFFQISFLREISNPL